VIDLHTHILPGIDDGVRTLGESIEFALAATRRGVTALAATPHVRDDFPTGSETMLRLVAEVREAVRSEGIGLEILSGGEIALEQLDLLDEEELRSFGLAGNPHYLLLEFPYHGWPLALQPWVVRLLRRGIRPVIAHPERNADVQADPDRLNAIVGAGALVQITGASLTGALGRSARLAARSLIRAGNGHLLASDDHGGEGRVFDAKAVVRALRDEALARWLTVDVPGAIAAGHELPPRPRERRRRRDFFA
jgi:protein-tyrosine phosphatase